MTIPIITDAEWQRVQDNMDALNSTINGSDSTTVTLPDGGTVDSVSKAISSLKLATPRGAWTTATAYVVKDLVTSGGIVYICLVAHTAGGSFSTDLAANKWTIYQTNFTSLAIGASYAGAVTPQTNGLAVQGKVTIGGGSSPTATGAIGVGDLHLENDVYTGHQCITHNDNSGNYPFYLTAKSRGTKASPTIIQDTNVLGEHIFQGYDGANYVGGAGLRAIVDGTPGINDIPTAIDIRTTADGSASGTSRWRYKPAGHFTPLANNSYDIGISGSLSVRDMFIQNSPTVTSDENTKTDMQPLKWGRDLLRDIDRYTYLIADQEAVVVMEERPRFEQKPIVQAAREIVIDEKGEASEKITETVVLSRVPVLDEKGNQVVDRVPVEVSPTQKHKRRHLGHGARQTKQALDKHNIPVEDFAALVIQKNEDGTEQYAMRKEEFATLYHQGIVENYEDILRHEESIKDLVKAVETLQSQVRLLDEEIASLKKAR